VLVPQHFGSLVFDRRTSCYLAFDHEATRLLIALQRDGIDGVLAAIQDEDERQTVLGFVDHYYPQRFFSLDGRLLAELRQVDVPPDHLVGPLMVHLEIIGACNLTCSHCFAGELPRNQNPLSLREMADLFTDLDRLGTFRVALTGGEPLLRKDLLDILDAALGAGLHPVLTTNALLLTEEMARELGKRSGVRLNVSLEGPDAAVNDAVRGAGTFDAVVQRLGLLRRHANFTLGFTLLASNSHLVRECVDLASRVGAQAVVFRPLYPVGMALHHLDLMPGFEQYTAALRELQALDEPGETGAGPSVQTGTTCGAGRHLCAVSVQGDVNPCGFLGPAFVTGNIREQPFGEIWRTGQAMRQMRRPPSGPDGFRGGCRARALVFAGSVDAPDPWMTEHEHGAGPHPCANFELATGTPQPGGSVPTPSGNRSGFRRSLPLIGAGS
jgi:MoaA/NifB/PqqE/SkfB family radical SAM enzyme